MTAAAKVTSATPAPNSPAVSRCQATSFTPTIGIRRYEGLNAATPQNAAGRITEPAVCVPKASGTMPTATAAADPAHEPPGVCASLPALRVGQGTRDGTWAVPALPSPVPPGCRVMPTAVASGAGR